MHLNSTNAGLKRRDTIRWGELTVPVAWRRQVVGDGFLNITRLERAFFYMRALAMGGDGGDWIRFSGAVECAAYSPVPGLFKRDGLSRPRA